MDLPLFHPNSVGQGKDKLAERLRSVARYILIAIGGLLPILFIPSIYLPFSAGKVLLVALAAAAATLFLVLAMLREGSMALRVPLALFGIWSLAAVTLASALLSGDIRDSLFGNALDSYSAFFVFLMALLMSISTTFSGSKQSIIKLYGVIIFSALVLSLFHLIRLAFGPEVLSFSIFTSTTSSLIGSWNGLAIFYGLVVILVLMALEQLPLSRAGRYVAIGVLFLALLMLAVINFLPAWWVLAIVCGVTVLYGLARNLWKKGGSSRADNQSPEVFIVAVVVLVLSVIFILGGARVGAFISEKLGVSYLEVRPSVGATVDITRAVYAEDLLLGSGPNRFADTWRINKDPAINQTIFWNTPFDSGFSYVTTSFIGTGVLGVLAYLLFAVGLLWSGLRFITQAPNTDRFWHFIGLSSLASSVYLFVMSAIYVPPPSILLLFAITTGVFLSAYLRLIPSRAFTLSAEAGRVYGLALIVVAVITLSAVGYVSYAGTNQLMAVYKFNHALGTVAQGDDVNTLDDKIVAAFDVARNDAFAAQIALHQLSQMRAVLTVAEPGTAEQQTFQTSAARAIEAANSAVSLDPTDPYNHQLLGQIYATLALVGVEGASDRARESYTTAKSYDPQSPVFDLLLADLAVGSGDSASARAAAEDAVRKKGNFTEALFFLAQLDINEGNVERAIVIVNGVAQLEPQNPARRYQLGVLLASADRLDEAVSAFEAAVALDPQYANARYFLALGYAEQGRVEEAIEQLTVVRGLNESNAVVDQLIEQLREEGSLSTSLTAGEVVPERDGESGNVTEEDLESGLVTSPNPVPEDNGGASDNTEAR